MEPNGVFSRGRMRKLRDIGGFAVGGLLLFSIYYQIAALFIFFVIKLFHIYVPSWIGAIGVAVYFISVVIYYSIAGWMYRRSKQLRSSRSEILAKEQEKLRAMQEPAYWQREKYVQTSGELSSISAPTPKIATLARYLAKKKVEQEMAAVGLHPNRIVVRNRELAIKTLMIARKAELIQEATAFSKQIEKRSGGPFASQNAAKD
jgi:hypothetical protein